MKGLLYLAGITEITRTLQSISRDATASSASSRYETRITNDFADPVALYTGCGCGKQPGCGGQQRQDQKNQRIGMTRQSEPEDGCRCRHIQVEHCILAAYAVRDLGAKCRVFRQGDVTSPDSCQAATPSMLLAVAGWSSLESLG